MLLFICDWLFVLLHEYGVRMLPRENSINQLSLDVSVYLVAHVTKCHQVPAFNETCSLTAIKLIVLRCFSQCVVSLLWLEIYRKHLLLTISQVLFSVFNSSCLPFFLCSHPSFGPSCDIHKVILNHSTTMIGTFLKLNTLKISSM